HLLGPGGEERLQFLPGEPLVARLRVVAARSVPPPRLSYELRDEAGLLLASGTQEPAAPGWREERHGPHVRFEVDRLPLQDGRFRLRFELADATGRHLYHWLDDALRFVVYPGADGRGVLRIEGRWTLE